MQRMKLEIGVNRNFLGAAFMELLLWELVHQRLNLTDCFELHLKPIQIPAAVPQIEVFAYKTTSLKIETSNRR
jgi:hypothetical protein